MPDNRELEEMLLERDLAEFPDDDAWEALKAEIQSQHAEVDDGENG